MDSMKMPLGIVEGHNGEGKLTYSGIYGKELLLDCYGCDKSTFTRESLESFFNGLVELIDMEKGDLHFWNEPTGLGGVQFILTSQISIHCADKLERVYVDIFSCKDFEEGKARKFVRVWFAATSIRTHVVYRV